jgi:hypothetical protein
VPSPAGYPERELADGSRICGERGTIRFFKSGQVSVQISGSFFDAQAEKLISRFGCNPKLTILFEHMQNPCTTDPGQLIAQLLGELIKIPEKPEFERALKEIVSSIRAAHKLSLKIVPESTKRFIAAIRELAREHHRPPTQRELADHLCEERSVVSLKERSVISLLCKEHGFSWLPKASAGRPSRTRRRRRNC